MSITRRPTTAVGVAIVDALLFEEGKPPIRYVRATNIASQMKYCRIPDITDSMNRSARDSLVMSFAIGAATSAAATGTSGL